MKTIVTLFFVALVASTSFAQKGKFKADINSSKVEWRGEKVTGYHDGDIKIKSADIEFKDGLIISGKVVIDMTTINCTDLSGGSKSKLEGHLKSDDFFSVDKFNEAVLEITSSSKQGNELKVRGNLTIKGTTKPIEFKATISEDGKTIIAKGNMTIDRTDYNVRYGSASFFDSLGDKAIYDNFELNFTLILK